MLLDLKKLFLNDGCSINFQYNLDMSDITLGGAKPFISPVSIDISAHNISDIVLLIVVAKFKFCIPCDRCLENTVNDYSYSFEHRLVQFLNGESDESYIEVKDDSFDLDKLIIEDILLEMSSKNLCKDDCKGLCPICGCNLNKGSCDCGLSEIDPRLETLKQFIK